MSLINSDTKWVLFLSSSDVDPEERHIFDLAYGLACLEKAGVQAGNIHIYVDGKDRAKIIGLFHIASNNNYNIKTSNDFFIDMERSHSKNLVMFITGHGSERGIDAKNPITPHRLLSALKSATTLDNAVVYLGQCFAGIFNYVKAGRNKVQNKCEPDIIFIGATGLQESLSSSTNEHFTASNQCVPWIANLFLLHVFKWISAAVDVDGDSLHTIMDSYKYAGVMTNRHHKDIKACAFFHLMDAYNKLLEAQNSSKGSPNILKQKALETKYRENSLINNIHQECWILNSIPAQHIEI